MAIVQPTASPAPIASLGPSPVASPTPLRIPNRPIAYAVTANLFLIQPTGGKATQLTTAGTNSGPGWSRDATKIAWMRILAPSTTEELWVINASGSSAHALTKGASTNKAPSWSPSGDRIAFTAKYATHIPQIWIIPSAGGTPVKLTSAESGETEPSWSPDGHSIVYAVAINGQLNLWRLDPDQPSVAPVQLTQPATGSDVSPAWSPDGTKIAFDSTRDGTDRIYVMNADGSDVQAATPASLVASWPAWSPDGTEIIFHVIKGSDTDLYVMPADGSAKPVDLTPDPSHNALDAAWW